MKGLLVGNGAREHAIAEQMAKGSELYTFMSANNPGIRRLSKDVAIGNTNDSAKVVAFAQKVNPDYIFIGPEAPLAKGVGDALEDADFKVAGPKQVVARLESDKGFCRELMAEKVPEGCPKFVICNDVDTAMSAIGDFDTEIVVKPAGLTGGKGVQVQGIHLQSIDEVKSYTKNVITQQIGGSSYVVLEEKLVGEEFTLQVYTDGKKVVGMPLVQDHKLAFEGDTGPMCYDEETEVLTEYGWKKFDEVKYVDKIATLDPETNELRYEKPTRIIVRDYDGEMLIFKSLRADLVVTPTHNMFICSRYKWKQGRREFDFVPANKTPSEFVVPQRAIWNCDKKEWFVLPAYKDKRGYMWEERKIKMDDWLAFFGIWLAEGSVTKWKSNYKIRIAQKDKEKKKCIRKLLKKLPFKFCKLEHAFGISSAQLYNYLSQFKGSHSKFIPVEIKSLESRQLKILLKWFAFGDGDIHHGQRRYCSISKKLIGDIQELLLKTGKVGNILKDKRAGQEVIISGRKSKHNHPLYSIQERKNTYTQIRKPNKSSMHYKGKVGCVTVSSHIIFVRRNGRPCWCGNTGGMGSYSDSNLLLPFVSENDKEAALKIIEKTLHALHDKTGEYYKGVLYGQFMLTKDGPKIIEYNVRFGDPEAMNVLPILKSDFSEICMSIVDGNLMSNIEFENVATVCKYLVPKGYPTNPESGAKVEISEGTIKDFGANLYYASVDQREDGIYTSRSRSFGIVGITDSISEAESIAQKAVESVKCDKLFFRSDIGKEELIQKRIKHMEAIRG